MNRTTIQVITPPVMHEAEDAFRAVAERLAPIMARWEEAGRRMRALTSTEGVPTWPTS